MKKLLVGTLSAAALAAVPQGALANNGSPVTQRVYEAARCILNEDRGEAVQLLRTLPLGDDEADLSPLADSPARTCVDAAAGTTAIMMRGALAQALFFRDFRRFGRQPTRPERLVDLDLPVQDSAGGDYPVDLYRWGDCVVRNDTRNTHALLTSQPGSSEETAALTTLQPFMAACHRGEGELTVRPSEARSVFAQAAYDIMYRYWSAELNARR
ncbi:hypothetical protein [Sphingosinicella terrae]|uniref:hypothetical protein n=1 Tax=Sphingosinicella terrae TaxID=2172047 RepID=UPI000E0D2DA0|nr:hypothetical protein [Sphingosinicella terrae]